MSLSQVARTPTPTRVRRAETLPVRRTLVRSTSAGTFAEFALASIGLFICSGLPEALAPAEFRIAKHAFYAVIMGLLLMRWQDTLQLASRDLVLCVFTLLLLTSALWSELPVWAFKRGVVMLQTTAFGLYLAARFSVRDQLRALSGVLVLVLAALTVSTLLDPVSAFASPDHPGAFRGPLVHKNQAALLMALAIPALLLQLLASPRRRVLLGAALVAAVLFLVLSRSLGGTLVAAMLGALVAAHQLVRPPQRWLLLLPTLVVALATLAAIMGLIDSVLIAVGKDPTLTGRTDIWDHTLTLFAQRPWLGHSMASFWQLEIVARTGTWFSNAHNGYLQLLIDLGLVGLSLFVVQLLITFVRALRLAGRTEPAALWPYCVAAIVLVYNLVEVSIVEENSLVWVLYVAISFAVRAPLTRRVAPGVNPALARPLRSARA